MVQRVLCFPGYGESAKILDIKAWFPALDPQPARTYISLVSQMTSIKKHCAGKVEFGTRNSRNVFDFGADCFLDGQSSLSLATPSMRAMVATSRPQTLSLLRSVVRGVSPRMKSTLDLMVWKTW